jgi:SOS-response transcriptional repressor LexA
MLLLDAPDLTKKQARFVCELALYQAEHGYPPSLRELSRKLNLKNVNAAVGYRDRLVRKGWVTVCPKQGRTLRLVKPLRWREVE